jgi:hypothetical protein
LQPGNLSTAQQPYAALQQDFSQYAQMCTTRALEHVERFAERPIRRG